jgi:hypothetical protein
VVRIQKDHNPSVTTASFDFQYTVQSELPVTKVSVKIDGRPESQDLAAIILPADAIQQPLVIRVG